MKPSIFQRPFFRPLIVTAVFILIFHRFWTQGVIFRDSFRLYAPIKMLVAAGWRAARLIGWNPYQYLGVPFISDILTGYFYPGNLIYLLLPFAFAHTWFILLHYPLAALNMDLFLRGEGIDRRASLFGGLTFALCGYMTCQHANMVFLIGPAWAPLGLYCFSRSLRESSVAWASAAGAVLCMQIFGGDPQSAALTAVFMTLWGAASVFGKKPEGAGTIGMSGRVFPLLATAIAGVSSFLLSAVQLLPTYELMGLSERAKGTGLTESSMFSYHPGGLIELIWPTPFGVLWPKFHFWGKFLLDSPSNNPWSITNYLGLPALCLAIVGLVRSRHRLHWWAGAAGAIFLFLSFGHNTPFYGFCHDHVPLVGLFRYPAKYMAWFSGAMAVLAALGLERAIAILEPEPALLKRVSWIWLAAVAVAVVLAFFLWQPALKALVGLTPALDPDLYDFACFHLDVSGIEFALVNLSAGAIGVLAARRVLSPRRGYWLFLVLCVLDWSLADVAAMPSAPYDIYTFTPAAAKIISPRRPELGSYRIIRRDMSISPMVSDQPQYSTFAGQVRWERTTLMPNYDNMVGFEDVQGYNAAIPTAGEALLNTDMHAWQLVVFNVRYILAPFRTIPESTGGIETAGTDQSTDLTVFRLTTAFPRAYWVPAARHVTDEKQAIAMMDQLDLRQYVILTAQEDVGGGEPGGRRLTDVKIASYRTDRVRIETNVDRAGWLVLSDRLYPGWEATIDGAPAHIYTANVCCRAVRLSPGPHQVEFRFRPQSVYLGALISVPAWIAALVWWAAALWRKRKKRYSDPSTA